MKIFSLTSLGVCLVWLCAVTTAQAESIEFETDANLINFGTYSEAGYTFTQSSFQVNIEDPGAGQDGRLVFRTFTNGSPAVRMTRDDGRPFDLMSLEVDEYGIIQTFKVTASSGATFTFSGVGQLDFSAMAGDWTNLTFVDFAYQGSSSSENISLDNIQAVPSRISVEADSFVEFRGINVQGSLADTFESDDSYLKYNPGITLSRNLPVGDQPTIPTSLQCF